MRGRNNNGGGSGNNGNRKGPNPLTRNYESNGPDVKIRGSAQQIAEKYAALARDAQSSGDRVMAENYLQHAEHYNRIIAAAQAQMPIQHVQHQRDEFEDDGEDEREDFESAGAGVGEAGHGEASASQHGEGADPQPVIEGVPAEVALSAEGRESGGNAEGGGRQREGRVNGNYRARGNQNNGERTRRGETPASSEALPSETGVVGEPAVAPVVPAQPEHLSPADLAARAALNEAENEAASPRRPRRPRRPRVDADAAAAETQAPVESAAGEPVSSEG